MNAKKIIFIGQLEGLQMQMRHTAGTIIKYNGLEATALLEHAMELTDMAKAIDNWIDELRENNE